MSIVHNRKRRTEPPLAAPRPALPSAAELQILRVLWARSPLTVRQVHAEVKRTAYSTTLTLMQKLRTKGLVQRDDTARGHTYNPTLGEQEILTALVRHVADQFFEGSVAALALRALGAQPIMSKDLVALTRLIRAMGKRIINASTPDAGRP